MATGKRKKTDLGQEWQLRGAKNRLSKVVDETQPDTPLFEFFRSSPLHGVELDLERSRGAERRSS